MRIWAMPAFAALGLSACATSVMSEKECLAGDWYAAGIEDGRGGLTETAFDDRAGTCAEFGAPADANAYFEGREAALAQLCTLSGGRDYAARGRRYFGVCRAEAERSFLEGYLPGRRIFAAQGDRDSVQDDYDGAVSETERQRERVRRNRARLDDPEAGEEELKAARQDLEAARRALSRAERDADDALYELGRADEALSRAISGAGAWRRSDEFLLARDALAEAHAFARAEDAIDHCTDELPYFAVRCVLRPGGALIDKTSDSVCASGPGEAVLARRAPAFRDGAASGAVLFFDFFPADPRTGRVDARPSAFFEALFDAEGAFEGVSCASPQPRP